jgi:hypothetical protein
MADVRKGFHPPSGIPTHRTPAAEAPTISVEKSIDRLAEEIAQFNVDSSRFFAGDLPLPPEELREAIERRLRGLRGRNLTRAVDRFRLSSLEARFNSYSELFNRRLRDSEEGRVVSRRAAVPASEPKYDVKKGVVIGAQPPPGAVEALYEGLVSRGGAEKMELETFRTYLDRQRALIQEKTGCEQIQFRLTDEEGRMKLKAKPVRAAAAARPGSR